MNKSCNDLHHRVVQTLSERYEGPLIDNKERGVYVEAMIAEILGSDWELTWRLPGYSTWSHWDLQNLKFGKKIEIKQSASWQAWHTDKPTVPQFSVKEREYIYLGDSGGEVGQFEEFDIPRRVVDLYIFAWHGVSSRDDADHRNCNQWEFL